MGTGSTIRDRCKSDRYRRCRADQACQDGACACAPDSFGDGRTCALPASCAELLVLDPAATTGIHRIDPDGDGPVAAFEVHCDMETEGGGWTQVLTTSDDVADGTQDLGAFMDGIPYPTCDLALADNGHELTGGTLPLDGRLCDTDLYFHIGDHESGEDACEDLAAAFNHAAFGPVWNQVNNDACPFDDPSFGGIGPSNPCPECPEDMADTEQRGLGFGAALNLNTGTPATAENHLQIYVR